MSDVAEARRQLVIANRILAHEGVLDAYGHVSIRHPEHADRYVMSRARAPELVEDADLFDLSLDGQPLTDVKTDWYSERFIHGAVYEARPDVMAVCHNHAPSILPFSISQDVKLQAVFHSGSFLGQQVPVWDIADEFGTETQLRVHTMEEGRSLSRTLGAGRVALMRGHGSVVVAEDLEKVVFCCIYMDKNATAQLQGLLLGRITPLHTGEIDARNSASFDTRAWEVWARRAGF